MLSGDARVDDSVERICAHGCRTVSAIIEALENGAEIDEVRELSSLQRQRVLQELKSIRSCVRRQLKQK